MDAVLKLLHVTSAGNEVPRSIEGGSIRGLKAFGIVQHEKRILIGRKFLLDIRFSRFELRNRLNHQSMRYGDGEYR